MIAIPLWNLWGPVYYYVHISSSIGCSACKHVLLLIFEAVMLGSYWCCKVQYYHNYSQIGLHCSRIFMNLALFIYHYTALAASFAKQKYFIRSRTRQNTSQDYHLRKGVSVWNSLEQLSYSSKLKKIIIANLHGVYIHVLMADKNILKNLTMYLGRKLVRNIIYIMLNDTKIHLCSEN